MNSTPEDRVFRLITVYTSAPGILLLIVHTLLTQRIVPIFGIIPMTISACSGLVHTSTRATNLTSSPAIDIFIALYLATVVAQLVVFIHGYHGWCGHGDEMMLAAYGTVPLIMNCCIHTFFALRETSLLDLLANLFSSLFNDVLGTRRCPSCQCEHGEAMLSTDPNSLLAGQRISKDCSGRSDNCAVS